MAIRKGEFKPPKKDGVGNVTYPDTVYLKTSGDQVLIEDEGGHFEIKNVEGALQEISGEISLLDNRVNSIITTPVAGVSAQEIVDARQGKGSLGTNLTSIKTQINTLSVKKADKTALNTEKTERLAEVEVERQRINAFTSLGEGSTTGDAELLDARIGADGTAYVNVGEAIRGQVGDLNDELEEHKLSAMPHQFNDIKENKIYQFGFQISADGNPQIIYEEVIQ